MGKLTTHVLDTTTGIPASGISVKLYKEIDHKYKLLSSTSTNKDGRCSEPLLNSENIEQGSYELLFDVENYFQTKGILSPFLKDVVIRFFIDNSSDKYHVPLLISPYSYSTYKGS